MSAVTDETTKIGIDESHISPVERRDSLEKHLQHRPDAQDLKNRNILLDSNAAPCVAYTPRPRPSTLTAPHSDHFRRNN